MNKEQIELVIDAYFQGFNNAIGILTEAKKAITRDDLIRAFNEKLKVESGEGEN